MTEIPDALVEKAAQALRWHIHVGTEVDVEPYARVVLAAVWDDLPVRCTCGNARRQAAEAVWAGCEAVRAAAETERHGWDYYQGISRAQSIAREVGEQS